MIHGTVGSTNESTMICQSEGHQTMPCRVQKPPFLRLASVARSLLKQQEHQEQEQQKQQKHKADHEEHD